MKDESTTKNEAIPTPRVVNIINFHGLTLWVVEAEGVEYVYAKPLSDLAGLDWRRSKRTITEEEYVTLYGTKMLKHPVFVAEGGSGATPSDGLYIRLDRARMYLARINTRNMKAKGNVEAAEALLQLQIEWAEALHQYETNGVAYKREKKDGQARLMGLIKARQATTNKGERKVITSMIADTCQELGYPVPKDDRQAELELDK